MIEVTEIYVSIYNDFLVYLIRKERFLVGKRKSVGNFTYTFFVYAFC